MAAREFPQHIADALNEQPHRSGFYNWIFVHQGEIRTFWDAKDDLEKYDVVQVNMSPFDMQIIPEVRNILSNSSTQLVINNDYVCEQWGKWKIDPYRYDQIQKMGDMVFGTEPHQVSNMINGTFCIPHPTNTKTLKRLGSDLEEDSIGFVYHWWAGETYLPNRTLEIAKKRFNIKKSIVYNYGGHEATDQMVNYNKAMFDIKAPILSFPQFAERIQADKIVYDPNPCHTYGRNGVELACFKKPVVGSNRVFSYNMLFPELTCDPYDNKRTLELMEKVLKNKEEILKMVERAHEQVEYYNYDNSRKRFMEALDIAKERGGSAWYAKNG